MLRALVLVLTLVSSVARAQPRSASDGCVLGAYAEPTLMATVLFRRDIPRFVMSPKVTAPGLLRAAGGGILECRGALELRVQLGATLFVSNFPLDSIHSAEGIGAELGGDVALNRSHRLGPRISLETASQGATLATAGLRYRHADCAWIGIDTFYLRRSESQCAAAVTESCTGSTWGINIGAGTSGRLGTYGAVVALVAMAIAHEVLKPPPPRGS